MLGEVVNLGDTENAEPLSETSDGAPSTLSALDPSETAGEGSASLTPRLEGKSVGVRVSAREAAGLGKDRF